MDLFSSGGIENRKASKESGIDRYGWNGEIFGSVNTILEVEQAQRINMHESMKYIGYKRTEKKMNTPKQAKQPKTNPKRPNK